MPGISASHVAALAYLRARPVQRPALHKCILEKCIELHMTRVSAVRGFEGYGGSSEIHRSRPLYHNLPIVITVIDVPDKIGQLVATVEDMMETGVIATFASGNASR